MLCCAAGSMWLCLQGLYSGCCMLAPLARAATRPSAATSVDVRQSTACSCKCCVWCAEPSAVLRKSKRNPPARPERAALGPMWPTSVTSEGMSLFTRFSQQHFGVRVPAKTVNSAACASVCRVWCACARLPERPRACAPNTPDPCAPIMVALIAVVCFPFHSACAAAADCSRLRLNFGAADCSHRFPPSRPFVCGPMLAGLLSRDGTVSCVKGLPSLPRHCVVQKSAPVCLVPFSASAMAGDISVSSIELAKIRKLGL